MKWKAEDKEAGTLLMLVSHLRGNVVCKKAIRETRHIAKDRVGRQRVDIYTVDRDTGNETKRKKNKLEGPF